MRAKPNTPQNLAPGIKPIAPWRVASVTAHPQFRLEVTFVDGVHGYVDLSHKIFSKHAGVFAQLQDISLFNRVFVEYGAVTWPGELDLAPDAMHDQIQKNGIWILQ